MSLLLATLAEIARPSFDIHENANNVYGRVPSPKTNGTGVVFIGAFDSAAACAKACTGTLGAAATASDEPAGFYFVGGQLRQRPSLSEDAKPMAPEAAAEEAPATEASSPEPVTTRSAAAQRLFGRRSAQLRESMPTTATAEPPSERAHLAATRSAPNTPMAAEPAATSPDGGAMTTTRRQHNNLQG